MHVATFHWQRGAWSAKAAAPDTQLVIYFAGQHVLDDGARFAELRAMYPDAHLLGCSTGGEIFGPDVLDGSISAAAITLSHTTLRKTHHTITTQHESFDIGARIASDLMADDLVNIFVLSDGTKVNGSDLIRGLYSVLPKHVIVTGGLAGDGADFGKTLVGIDALPTQGVIAAVGFYGNRLKVGYGSVGGWDPFGPTRMITKSEGPVLLELDNSPALELYKKYLGEESEKLPGSGLMFPLKIWSEDAPDHDIVRTVVGIDEERQALIFAGDVPQGHVAQLMYGDFNHLIDGAARAAELALTENANDSLAILVSCIGRKLLLGQNIADETEAVDNIFGSNVPMIGFYSYGEICHQQFTHECGLHNQTMTITVLHEV